MKKIFLFVATLLPFSPSFSQEDDILEKTYFYIFNIETPVFPSDMLGQNVVTNHVLSGPAHSTFTLIGKTDEYMIIKFGTWKNKASVNYKTFNAPDPGIKVLFNEGTDDRFFAVRKSDFETNVSKYFQRSFKKASFSASTLIVPVKIRFNDFDFADGITLGPAFGAKWRISSTRPHYFSVLGGVGIGTVSLDSLSTKGQITGSSSNRAALSGYAGCVFEFNKAQIGIFIGKDYLSKKENIDWKYQGKTWLSLGLGFSIINDSEKNKSQGAPTN